MEASNTTLCVMKLRVPGRITGRMSTSAGQQEPYPYGDIVVTRLLVLAQLRLAARLVGRVVRQSVHK